MKKVRRTPPPSRLLAAGGVLGCEPRALHRRLTLLPPRLRRLRRRLQLADLPLQRRRLVRGLRRRLGVLPLRSVRRGVGGSELLREVGDGGLLRAGRNR